MARGVAASALSLALFVSVGGAAASSSPRPDLVVSRVSAVLDSGGLHVTALVANRGVAAAPRGVATFGLGGHRVGARGFRALRAGTATRIRATFSVPVSIPAGSYRLRVCVDAAHRIREGNERNNCLATTSRLTLGDRRPPTFAGLERATTCIPGPAGGPLRSSRYGLHWQAATDDSTPAGKLVYDIYQAKSAGGEDFAKPTYTSDPGATSFSTPPLPDDAAYYFVVRARDAAGNRDGNRVERVGMNLCV
jgi:CARDB